MALSEAEMLLIAGLRDDPGYNLLLEKLAAFIDDVTERLHNSTSLKEDSEILPYWKALKTVYNEFKGTPEEIINYMDSVEISKENNKEATNHLQDFFNKLQVNQQHMEKEAESMRELFDWSNKGQQYKSQSIGNFI